MIELLYALRLLSGQIVAEDVPDEIYGKVSEYVAELKQRDLPNK